LVPAHGPSIAFFFSVAADQKKKTESEAPRSGRAGVLLVAAEPGETEAEMEIKAEMEKKEDARWKPVLELPCELIVDLPLPDFKISDLLKLRVGSVLEAHLLVGEDVPARLNGTLMGWIEFELVGNRLAVRLTELA
jgi:flagellar motor switch/type III secretory pathway protein FliN